MKKIILPIILCLGIVPLMAQPTDFDALKMAQTDIVGTARYMGMAGAFGALGGDVSAVKDNPAGLGVYRSSEITTTFNIKNQRSVSTWNQQTATADMFNFTFSNFSYVLSLPTVAESRGHSSGLLRSNFGFSYNRLKNFHRNSNIRGNSMPASYTDYLANMTNVAGIRDTDFDEYDYGKTGYDDIPWLSVLAYDTWLTSPEGENGDDWKSLLRDGETVSPSYFISETGYVDEYSFSWGGNVSNMFYFGASVNIQTLVYNKNSRYGEDFGNSEFFKLNSLLSSSGWGVNMNIGVIYRPIDLIRIGVSYRTPTVYSMHDSSKGYMDSGVDMNARYNMNEGFVNYSTDTYLFADAWYRLRVPGQWTGSLGFILGRRAIVSADFVYTDYRNTRLAGDNGDFGLYDLENERMRNTAKGGITMKFGAEYRVTDHLSVRAGFAAATAISNPESYKDVRTNTKRTDSEYFHHKGTNYFTAGLGYRGNFWYVDATFVNKNVTENFYPYDFENVIPATVKTHNFDVVATIGFKF